MQLTTNLLELKPLLIADISSEQPFKRGAVIMAVSPDQVEVDSRCKENGSTFGNDEILWELDGKR